MSDEGGGAGGRRSPAVAPEVIGLVGAGEIGCALGCNALGAGYRVFVYDRTPEATAELQARGAAAVASFGELARRASVVQVAVMDDEDVREVFAAADGVPAACPGGAVILIHSTIRPRTVRDLAAQAALRGIAVLDAPVTDPFGAHGILSRTASFLVGGDVEALERVRPILRLSAQRVFHLGPAGAGATAKLVRNLTMYVTLLAAHESRRLADAAGIERQTLRDILASSGAGSAAMDHFLSRTEYDDAYRARLPALTRIFEKDIRLALELAAELGLELPGGTLALREAREMLAAPPPSAER
jgi:3-hydroxyisobutyrate dehydrogenase-like beta-hydroxyacid dehydrogenase